MNIFVISWFFPPINSSEALVTFKLLKNSHHQYTVFTQNTNDHWSYSKSENLLSAKNITTIYSSKRTNNKLEPDYSEWIKDCVEFFKEHHTEYDAIMSRAMPPDSHQAAIEIKRLFPDTPWIASFGDPLKDNPFSIKGKPTNQHSIKSMGGIINASIKKVLSPKRMIKSFIWTLRQYKHNRHSYETNSAKIEDQTIKLADYLIFNNQYEMNYIAKNAAVDIKEKSIIIPHAFDKDFYTKQLPNKSLKDKKIIFRYLGHLDAVRTPLPLLKAIKKIVKQDPNIMKSVVFEFYGTLDGLSKIFIIDNELTDIVKVFPRGVSYFESLKLMQTADWLLLIDGNFLDQFEDNIFYAAKLSDYLGSTNKIFAITTLGGASADIIRDTGNVISSHITDEIAMRLKQIIANKLPDGRNYKAYQKFDIKNVAKAYDEWVECCIRKVKKS